MKLAETLLEQLHAYLDIRPSALERGVLNKMDGARSDFALEVRPMGDYDEYRLSAPLLCNLIHTTQNHTTQSFLLPRFRSYIHDAELAACSRLHNHNYLELVYVLEGNLELLIEHQKHHLFSGSACIINPNTKHQELHTAEYAAIYLGFPPSFPFEKPLGPQGEHAADPLTEFIHRNSRHTNQVDYLVFTPLETLAAQNECRYLQALSVQIFTEFLEQRPGYRNVLGIYLQRMFASLQNKVAFLCSGTRFQPAGGDSLYDRTVHYIHTQKRKVSRMELQEVFSYNGNYISRVFQKNTGESLASYIRDVCLTEAAQLLLNTELPVREICQRVGYENKTVFYKLFAQKYGMTPHQYRHQMGSF